MTGSPIARWLAAGCFGLAYSSAASALTPSELFAKVAPSVWGVRTYDADGQPIASGSAVVVASGTLITNCHVLRNAKRVAVTHEATSVPATLALWDPERDVCQLRSPGVTAPAVALGDSTRLLVGQTVYALGAPEGLELTLSAGLISSLRRNATHQLEHIQTSAPISHGSSGGGLFDEQGQLVGITTAMVARNNAQNLNFAVPVDFVRDLPRRHQQALERGGAAPPQTAGPAEAPPAAAPPAPMPPPIAATPARALTLADRVPFLNDRREADLKGKYLRAESPKACAISDNGHYGCAWGYKTRSPSEPIDPQQRALQMCASFAGKPCMIYVVDDVVVYVQR